MNLPSILGAPSGLASPALSRCVLLQTLAPAFCVLPSGTHLKWNRASHCRSFPLELVAPRSWPASLGPAADDHTQDHDDADQRVFDRSLSRPGEEGQISVSNDLTLDSALSILDTHCSSTRSLLVLLCARRPQAARRCGMRTAWTQVGSRCSRSPPAPRSSAGTCSTPTPGALHRCPPPALYAQGGEQPWLGRPAPSRTAPAPSRKAQVPSSTAPP